MMNDILASGRNVENAPYSQVFAYSAYRKAHTNSLLTLGLLLASEGCIVIILLVALKMELWLRCSLLGVYGLLICWLVFKMLSTTRTRHHLDSEALHLHYGSFRTTVSRSLIASAKPVREIVPLFAPLGARYDAMKKRVCLTFSDQGLIELRLREPLMLKLGERTSKPVTSLLFNVNEPEALLAALNHTPQASSQESESLPRVTAQRAQMKGAEPAAIVLEGVSRRFGTFQAVADVHMSLQPGEIYGFLGSNGAGKSTTIKMLVGLLQPSSGNLWIDGHNVWTEPLAAKATLGYVADHAVQYERLSGRAFLRFLAQMRSIPRREAEERIQELLDVLDLAEQAERLCGSYSYGMKRKLSVAGALLHRPTVLVLDEPLNGLDPRSARRLKDLFITLASQGTTILLSTHDLATAEEICHRVGIIHKGRFVAQGQASELRELSQAANLEEVFLALTEEGVEVVI